MTVREAVDEAIVVARLAYTEGGDTEPFNEVSFGRIVAMQAIANILDVEFTEVARQYLAEVPQKKETPCVS